MSKIYSNRRKGSEILLKATTCAMMIALSVILCRYFGFPSTGMFRVEIGFLPIAIVAILYGPFWSAISYGFADFIGALIFTPPINPFILLCKIVFGLVMGFAFYGREKIGLARNILFFLIKSMSIFITNEFLMKHNCISISFINIC